MKWNSHTIGNLDYNQLSTLYGNACKIISSVEGKFGKDSDFENRKKYHNAKEVEKLIRNEWGIRRRRKNPESGNKKYPKIGVLRKLGYKELYQLNHKTRILIIKNCIAMENDELPFTYTPEHMETWGESKSKRRYAKIMVYLRNQITSMKRASEKTVEAWKDDLAETLNICPHKSVNDWFQEKFNKKNSLDINSKMDTEFDDEIPF